MPSVFTEGISLGLSQPDRYLALGPPGAGPPPLGRPFRLLVLKACLSALGLSVGALARRALARTDFWALALTTTLLPRARTPVVLEGKSRTVTQAAYP